MNREMVVLLIGILILIVPALGIPSLWKTWFLYGSGMVLIIVGYSLKRSAYLRSIESETGERETESYVESSAQLRLLNNSEDPL